MVAGNLFLLGPNREFRNSYYPPSNRPSNHPTTQPTISTTIQPTIKPTIRPDFPMGTLECFQFLLDLSGNSGIPSQWRVGVREVAKWISIQPQRYNDIQLTNHFHRGCFSIQTGDRKSADFLRSFVLEINWNGKTKRVPLKQAPSDKPKLWVRFQNTCVGVMAQLPNDYFDKFLQEAGFVVVKPTEKRTQYATKLFNGQRSALCQRGPDHIARNHEWIGPEGHVFKWRIEYDDQPFDCFKGCNIFHHDGKCPKWEKQKAARDSAGQQKCFFYSSSSLRLNEDTKMTRTDAIPGAKIGHMANHINNDPTILGQAEVIAIQVGANMDLGSVEISKPHVDAQINELVQVVKPLVEAEKKVFIIDPVAGPLVKEAEGVDHWAMVRQRMKKVAKRTGATWISLANINWIPEEDIHEDHVHYSVSGATKVMKTVAEKIKEQTGIDAMANMNIQEKPYSGIYRHHWKVGCYRCTNFHDWNEACPALAENNSSGSSSEDIEPISNIHNISVGDSWDEDSDVTPTNGGHSSSSSSSSTAASHAIASYNKVAASGSAILNELSEVTARNRSTSTKRARDTEGGTAISEDKRPRTKESTKLGKGHNSRANQKK